MSQSESKMSRRQFMGVAGGVLGSTAVLANTAGLIDLNRPPQVNQPKINADSFEVSELTTDVLVIGGGMAGLFAAVRAADEGASTMIVSKGRLGSSGLTPFAKGIFSYDNNPTMTVDDFVAKVGRSAIETNNPVFTRQLAEHSTARVGELKQWGFFESPLCNHSFMVPINQRNIPLHERIMITHLIKDEDRVVGASGFSLDEQKIVHFRAKTVVMCTGAGAFKPNGFPVCDLTHDGTIMAYKIGAKVTGKEWNDGHPGSAENSASSYDNWHGQIEEKPNVTGTQINHHLGVDDNYQAYALGPQREGAGGPPTSSQSDSGGPFTPAEFRQTGRPPEGDGGPPQQGGGLFSFFSSDKPSGPPGMTSGMRVGGSSAGMAIHKAEGLVPIDEYGQSTIKGLYAAGDALGSYMSGGIYTQIGSSLAGSAVQGHLAGIAAARECRNLTLAFPAKSTLANIELEILAPLKRERGYSPAWVTQVLQGVMIPNFVLYIKKERMMNAALAYVEELQESHLPMLVADDLHALRLAHESENMLISAEMKLKASIIRTESRCSHYRVDCPDIDYENWQAWLNIIQAEDGSMQFEKQRFDQWPEPGELITI
ncbi:FAD-dependent oxidoreductase [Vibrio ulleungensis]|uniref:FAD-binding protein n=1 Tax=Vibrio ulleungensis TaxID=2807619 RepID=A0ABS2HD47_9VIBR|nr:FAD-binding protein [Vibrio ulleungensis]MBM7035518.1 FAD-binding protein [Vibrio ulleungensis]